MTTTIPSFGITQPIGLIGLRERIIGTTTDSHESRDRLPPDLTLIVRRLGKAASQMQPGTLEQTNALRIAEEIVLELARVDKFYAILIAPDVYSKDYFALPDDQQREWIPKDVVPRDDMYDFFS